MEVSISILIDGKLHRKNRVVIINETLTIKKLMKNISEEMNINIVKTVLANQSAYVFLLNGESLTLKKELRRQVEDNDQIAIFPAIVGG